MKKNGSKQKVIDAASTLFYQKGFHGTSVRDIANAAAVNVSLISYYFKSKQGLLEYAITNYYDEYIDIIVKSISETETWEPIDRLKKLISSIIQYKQENYQFSCFVLRELSFDSIFVREMLVTYIAKENYYLTELFNKALQDQQKSQLERDYLFMQLKGMLVTPYVLQNEVKSRQLDAYSERLFIKRYVNTIHDWLDYVTLSQHLASVHH